MDEINNRSIKHSKQDLPPMSTPYSVLLEPRQDKLSTNLAETMAKVINDRCNKHEAAPQCLPAAQMQREIKLATKEAVKKEATIPEDVPIKETIGKVGLMWPCTYAQHHPATPLLQKFSTEGCPADCGPAWTTAQIEAAIQHGPHKSARSPEARSALHLEAQQKVKQGFTKIVKYREIKSDLPTQLKVSPAACIPHKSRKFRVILDLSFPLRFENTFINSVNDTKRQQAPSEAMGQLRSCFKRLVATMADNCDRSKPFYFSKLDVKEGFWRMVVAPEQAWNFAYVLLAEDGKPVNLEDIELVVPDALQMGWCESPLFFCTASETTRDVIQELIDRPEQLLPHKFENKLIPPEINRLVPRFPVCLLEVFVNDFIVATNEATLHNF